ncbi:MFS transporter [Actinokineospora diospyrosa]|uniref:MFS transporter, DHA2 family, multidrug resistance protein n=1 Tax=Actinokineospora diospyrosa TaxID=103728 RepID=A0ABT1IIM8_9PSEU|nr:MFS transporter [Actinokineospora diospyrosa]MCP2272388.1 MFS transporter, DHA2 family, multidrug resistance protein [Actinokineospora diospyrosa]
MIEPRAGRREWIGLAVLVLPCLLISMDVSVLFFALPFISADLHPSGTEQLWVMDVYGFALAGLLITMGALGDRIGRRKLLLIGAAAFGVASVVAAYSWSAEVLILTRGLLGVAGATLMPSTLSLIRAMFHDGAQRKTAIAVWTGGLTLGATVGPIVGGFLLEHFWWGSAFLINVPAMVLLLVLGPVLLPEYRNPDAGRFDLRGAALSLAAVLAVIYGIKQLAVDGFAPLPVAALVVGLLLGWAFVHGQRTGRSPLVDVALFRVPAFSGAVVVNVIAMFCFIGSTYFTTQYLQLVLGMRPFTAALWSLAAMPLVIVGMTVTGVLASKVRVAALVATGLVVLAIAFLVLTRLTPTSPLWLVLLGAGGVAAGVLMTTSLTSDLMLTAAPAEHAGAASAVSETASELGGALGMAILGTIGTAIYRADLPAGPSTLGEATGSGDPALIAAAREAFTHGLTVTATVTAAVAAVLAFFAYRILRHIPVTTNEPVAA